MAIIVMLKSRFSAGKPMVDGGLCFSQVTFADRESVKSVYLAALIIGLRSSSEVVFDILPVIAALIIGAERATGVVSAMDHAVFAARIAGDAIDYAVFIPINFRQHLLIAGIMAIRHQVTRRLPPFDVTGGNGPGG